jgi:PAT family acetyl-CoA transporter-like MFS transporter 1
MLVVYLFPTDTKISTEMFSAVIASTVMSSFMRYELHIIDDWTDCLRKGSAGCCLQENYIKIDVNTNFFFFFFFFYISTVQFVSISAFFTVIADPVIGGTYMTVSSI